MISKLSRALCSCHAFIAKGDLISLYLSPSLKLHGYASTVQTLLCLSKVICANDRLLKVLYRGYCCAHVALEAGAGAEGAALQVPAHGHMTAGLDRFRASGTRGFQSCNIHTAYLRMLKTSQGCSTKLLSQPSSCWQSCSFPQRCILAARQGQPGRRRMSDVVVCTAALNNKKKTTKERVREEL